MRWSPPSVAVAAAVAAARSNTALAIAGLALVAGGLLAGPAVADTLLESRHQADPVKVGRMTTPAVDETVQTWIGDGRFAHHQSDTSVILDGGAKAMFVLNHAEKTYVSYPLPLDAATFVPQELAPMVQMMSKMMRFDATVVATGESKRIGSWNTKLYKVTITGPMGLQIQQDQWTTRDIDLDYDRLKEFIVNRSAMVGLLGGDWWRKLQALDGYPVLVESRTTAGKKTTTSRDELLSVERKAAPAGTYEPPKNYRQVEFSIAPR